MTDPSYFDAQMQEHGAEPAHLFTGPSESPVMVIVRAFADDEAIRLTIEDRSGEVNQQLLINRNALRHLADDPEGDIAGAIALSSESSLDQLSGPNPGPGPSCRAVIMVSSADLYPIRICDPIEPRPRRVGATDG